MGKQRNKAHIHRFIKITGKFVSAWRCGIVGCRYVRYHGQQELMVGLLSLCWECGLDFPMEELNLTQEMPTCARCRMKQDETLVQPGDIETFLKQKEKTKLEVNEIEIIEQD